MDESWPEPLQSVIDDFRDCFDRMERYELLFDYAKQIPNPLPLDEWTEENRVRGCQSEAHIETGLDEGGGFLLRGSADAQIVQGLMAVLQIAVNGRPPSEVALLTPDFVDAMDVRASLTPSRANGFLNMFEQVKARARGLIS